MKNSNIYSKTPYIRFITKNLEINFDWLRLICETFKDELQFTSQTQEKTLQSQENAIKAQEKIKQKQEGHQWYTERTKEFITRAKDRLTRAQNNNMPIFDIDLKCYE
ncbi:hypothetical protein ['Catharanthus roseus' aster yellows phytoplasma]|uniref:Uncharacterized protein n=1 Tax='Catharanthus roseus' aster yellows phytoplasma TaxID=1193712 RepID=A0A4V0Z8W5_9MOLU|nr:hypothetical protein ['Catharanthus roseus' aster yellows phytoplasma]QBF23686.1 hypothetical protein EXT02_00380 ['Catharanthus roseus' aster yellows phytoplasma]